ncbi:MAG: hypothetical protein ACI3W8_01765 [Oscillospiraceae bacterium]
MKQAMLWSRVFAVLALLLSHTMCAVVAYEYCALDWGGRCALTSFPPSTAFLLAVPYGCGILLCALLALFFRRGAKQGT